MRNILQYSCSSSRSRLRGVFVIILRCAVLVTISLRYSWQPRWAWHAKIDLRRPELDESDRFAVARAAQRLAVPRRAVFASPDIIKLGFDVSGDFRKLHRTFPDEEAFSLVASGEWGLAWADGHHACGHVVRRGKWRVARALTVVRWVVARWRAWRRSHKTTADPLPTSAVLDLKTLWLRHTGVKEAGLSAVAEAVLGKPLDKAMQV